MLMAEDHHSRMIPPPLPEDGLVVFLQTDTLTSVSPQRLMQLCPALRHVAAGGGGPIPSTNVAKQSRNSGSIRPTKA